MVAFLAKAVWSSQSQGWAGRGDALLRTDKFLQQFLEPGGCSDRQSRMVEPSRYTAPIQHITSECSREKQAQILQRQELDGHLPVAASSTPAEQEVNRDSGTPLSEKLVAKEHCPAIPTNMHISEKAA